MDVTAVLVVPNGTHRPGALARAISGQHPTWTVGAVWCGDPLLRPRADAAPWSDAGAHLPEAVLAGAPAHAAEWLHALDAAAEVIARGSVAVLAWVGAVAVTGPLHALIGPIATGRATAVLVPHWIDGVPTDQLAPDARSLVRDGAASSHLAVFGPGAEGLLADVRRSVRAAIDVGADEDVRVGRVLDLVTAGRAVARCTDRAIGVGPWRWPDGAVHALVVPGYDVDRPWRLGVEERTPVRVELVGHPERRSLMAAAAPQLTGARRALRLPGGVPVDAVVRQVARDHPHVRPWSDPAGFRELLAEAYWPALHDGRADLRRAFPDLADPRFHAWRRRAPVDDGAALLIPPVPAARHDRTTCRVRTTEPVEDGGVNVVGYLTRSLGLGEIARRLAAACAAAGVPTSTIDHRRTQSPSVAFPGGVDDAVRFHTSVAVVNADQWDGLLGDLPALADARRRLIGYWFWEAEVVPEVMRRAMRRVDSVWAPTTFVAEALARADLVPVHRVPLPIPEPHAVALAREQLPPLAGAADRFVFLVAFDHLSVMARKNPLAAIEAYRRAFPTGASTTLVVKTMNARHRRHDHTRLRRAAAGRPDVVVWDGDLDRPEQMALVEAADCLVSLHRSEGLGLHLAEAMWLGTPTIATRYSGNLDLADDTCAALVDADLVPIVGGDGVYPGTGRWAEPRIDDAVAAMRRMVDDASWRASLAAAARERMAAQPTLADAGRTIARLLADP